jgi:hypothetical protein
VGFFVCTVGLESRPAQSAMGLWPVGSYHAERAVARRAFIVVPYEVGRDGTLAPFWPSAGPCAREDGRPCRLGRDHSRERKTGPGHALVVASCSVHGRGFTLYPPGYLPYGRRAVAPVASDGTPIVAEEKEARPAGGRGRLDRFSGTCFEAALDAAEGRAWPRRFEVGGSVLRWETQRRTLVRQTTWLGVGAETTDARREAVSAALGVPLILLLDAGRMIAARPGYRSRGLAICAVLRALRARDRLDERLAGAAHAAGFVGLPLRFDSRARALRAPPSFRSPGTRAPPRRRRGGHHPRNRDSALGAKGL